MNIADTIKQIEADRRRREKELLFILLLLCGSMRFNIRFAIRHGMDLTTAMQNVWFGNQHFSGLVTPMARAMTDAHLAGYRRAAGLTGMDAQPDEPAILDVYKASARTMAQQSLETLLARIQAAIANATTPDERVKAVSPAFTDGGYGPDNPSALRRIAERAIVQAGNDGMLHAASQPDLGISGFRHHSVDDAGTTQICSERSGLTLPFNDTYWLTNWPQLHFGCRSIVLPVMGKQEWSTRYPTTPPAPGWGIMPTWLPGIRNRAHSRFGRRVPELAVQP